MKSALHSLKFAAALILLLGVVGIFGLPLIDSLKSHESASVAQHKWAARQLPSDQRKLPRRFEVDCDVVVSTHPFVIAAFGQSNSANYGQRRYVPLGSVYEVKDNQCYLAQDPLLGSDGSRGSVWTRLADQIIARGGAPAVVLVSFGVSGSAIARWTPGGDLNGRITERLTPLTALGLEPDVVLFHQGETDAKTGTSGRDYLNRLRSVVASVRSLGLDAPFLVAVTSYCHGRTSEAVTTAQQAAVDAEKGVYAGPDTDEIIDSRNRFDDCHFSDIGLDRAAVMWLDSLEKSIGLSSAR